jgi:hypothetical protein
MNISWDGAENTIGKSFAEEAARIRSFKFKGKVVRHFKGDKYLVLDFARHTETGELMAIYKALYGECELYVRPYSIFNEEVPEGKENPTGQKYRFELCEIKSVKEDK